MSWFARLRDDRGMTLVELSIVSVLFTLIVFGAFSALDSGTTAERGQAKRHEALLELRQAMTRLTKDMRQALEIDASFSNHNKIRMTTLVGGATKTVTYSLELVDATKGLYNFRREVTGSPSHVIVETMVVNTTSNPDPPFCYSFDSGAETPICVDDNQVPSPRPRSGSRSPRTPSTIRVNPSRSRQTSNCATSENRRTLGAHEPPSVRSLRDTGDRLVRLVPRRCGTDPRRRIDQPPARRHAGRTDGDGDPRRRQRALLRGEARPRAEARGRCDVDAPQYLARGLDRRRARTARPP